MDNHVKKGPFCLAVDSGCEVILFEEYKKTDAETILLLKNRPKLQGHRGR